ncbi:MAG: hypothetical protein AAF467_24615 [Actinomycetota bacterium]
MIEQLGAVSIQALFWIALLKFTLWPLFRIARRNRRARSRPIRQRQKAARRPTLRRQPPPPDALEVAHRAHDPYATNRLAEELTDAIGMLLITYGTLGVRPADVAQGLDSFDPDHHFRPAVRIKMTAAQMAEQGVDDDLAVTAWLLELHERLQGNNAARWSNQHH